MTGWTRLPIRVRLTVAFAGSMALVIAGLSVFVYLQTGSVLLSTIDAGLRSRAELIATNLQHRGPVLADVEPSLIEIDEVFAQIAAPSGRIVQSSSIISHQHLLPAATVREVSRTGEPQYADRAPAGIDNQARVLAVPVDTSEGRYIAIVGASLQDRADALAGLAATLAIAGAFAICMIALGAWLAVSRALRPVENMRQEAAAISVWDPGRRLPLPPGRDELALLGGTLNEMLDRIEDSVDRERQLVDRASHELRTPLAIQRIDLDLALSGPQTVAQLQAALRSVAQENRHLTRLTEDLLILARARDGLLPVQLAYISLSELLAPVRRRSEIISGAGDRVSFDAGPGRVRIDPVWMGQAIGNLVDNAVRYAPPDTAVAVRAERRDGMVRITVQDEGPGLPEALLGSAVGGPGQSPDGAELRSDSAGLGLAVVRAIAEAHGGRVWAQNLPGGGARVTMTARDAVPDAPAGS